MLIEIDERKALTAFLLSSGKLSPFSCFNQRFAANGLKGGILLSIPFFAWVLRYAFKLILAPGNFFPPTISTLQSSSSAKKSLAIFGIFKEAYSLWKLCQNA